MHFGLCLLFFGSYAGHEVKLRTLAISALANILFIEKGIPIMRSMKATHIKRFYVIIHIALRLYVASPLQWLPDQAFSILRLPLSFIRDIYFTY